MNEQDGLSPEKERQILRGAADVFADAGYEGASMARIAAAAGVSKGTLYNYFAGKRDLFAAFLRQTCERRVALIFDELDSRTGEEAALREICRRMLEMLCSDEGLLVFRMVVAEAAKFPELAEVFYDVGPRRALARLAAWIERNVAAGRLRVDDAEFAAEQLFALMQTRLLLRRRLNLQESVTPEEVDRVVTAGVRLFLRGYGVEPT